eukprot:Gb_41544 [translate_table: standard]
MLRALPNQRKAVLIFRPVIHLNDGKPALSTTTLINIESIDRHHGTSNAKSTSYSSNINGDVRILCRQSRLKEALHILHLMDRPDSSAYASLLQGCVDDRALPEGKLVHAHIIYTEFQSQDIFLANKLVIMYAKCGSLVDARRVLDQMPKQNVLSWTVMIVAYARHGHSEDALKMFSQMQRTGIQPDQFTFASVLPACAHLASLEHGRELHEDIIRSGFQSDIFVSSSLVDMYAKCRRIENARQVFDKMSERNVVSWNVMIAAYAKNGYVGEALELFQKMPERDAVSWNLMIVGYVQNGPIDEALKLFQRMPEPDVVSWNAMIAGFTQNGHFDKALNAFRRMQLTCVEPNPETFTSILSACANLAAMEHGKEVHGNIIRSGCQSDVFVGSTLVDMYAKCGSIENARKVFDKVSRRDVVSWTSMITGYAMHGCPKEALRLFEQMEHSGTTPDHVTFVGVLSACCHAGLVQDGWQYFDRMSRCYHITPAMKHYCCMVDLLGRAGHLDEAEDFINKMPLKPDAAVWGSLLGACGIHTNIELGERVADQLFELDSKNAAHYVLLSNIYAAAGRWDGIEKVRKMMKYRGVEKIPGCSWIEVNGKVYSFLVGDRSHPQTQEIYAKLETLSGQIKEAGYLPDTRFVLRDVELEQKEHILCYHSEKLAIAFGLLNTSPEIPIRIVKNLRVCGDCHSAIKFISKTAVREIVVRDSSRFHHFNDKNDGQCSCGDYW